ncbi:hypothetical protein NAD41_002368 [Salmonella enterica]|nr:hypothetical protein [Salmonella enterica]EKK6596336.1 hypothetical protein [Salmonella enterica]
MIEAYHRIGGKPELFNDAPPMAQVVLEDISKRTPRIIYAEAFRTGATWWHADGRRGRRGLKQEQMSDFICMATRSPRRAALQQLQTDQLRWDLAHYKGEPVMYTNTRPCVNCGEPVADGMVHQCKQPFYFTPVEPAPVIIAPPTVTPKRDAFVSVFEPQNRDNWFRLNTAGRIKFSEALMMRFTGLKIDVAVDHSTGRVRVGEAEHGKVLNDRGYCFARRLTPLVDYKGQPSVLVYLHENDDGYLYGDLNLVEYGDGTEVE